MSVAPLIPPQESSSATSVAGGSAARPKRITPPAHWKAATPAAAPKKAPATPALPAVMPAAPAAATLRAPVLSRWQFTALLLLSIVALNLLLIALFPLPPLQSMRREAPPFSLAPTAEDSELPVWLRP